MRKWNADRSFAELTLIDLLEQRAETGPTRRRSHLPVVERAGRDV